MKVTNAYIGIQALKMSFHSLQSMTGMQQIYYNTKQNTLNVVRVSSLITKTYQDDCLQC